MRRIEDFLIVQELNIKVFNHAVHEDLLFAAIYTPSAGYEVDYERLELFGLFPRCSRLTQHFVGIAVDSEVVDRRHVPGSARLCNFTFASLFD